MTRNTENEQLSIRTQYRNTNYTITVAEIQKSIGFFFEKMLPAAIVHIGIRTWCSAALSAANFRVLLKGDKY